MFVVVKCSVVSVGCNVPHDVIANIIIFDLS
jgi:hypothetical protein